MRTAPHLLLPVHPPSRCSDSHRAPAKHSWVSTGRQGRCATPEGERTLWVGRTTVREVAFAVAAMTRSPEEHVLLGKERGEVGEHGLPHRSSRPDHSRGGRCRRRCPSQARTTACYAGSGSGRTDGSFSVARRRAGSTALTASTNTGKACRSRRMWDAAAGENRVGHRIPRVWRETILARITRHRAGN